MHRFSSRVFGRSRLKWVAVITLAAAAIASAGRVNIKITGMQWRTVDGKTHNLDEINGKTVVWYFWATTAPASVQELRHVAEMYKSFGSRKDFELIAVNLDGPNTNAAAQKIIKQLNAPWQQIATGEGVGMGLNKQLFDIKEADLPAISLMNGDHVIFWSDKADKVDEPLAKKLGVPFVPDNQNPTKPLGAVHKLVDAMDQLTDRGEYTPALNVLDSIPMDVLRDPAVMPIAMAFVARMKMDSSRMTQIERSLTDRPQTIKRLRLINNFLTAAAAHPLPGQPAAAKTDAPASDNSALADRRLEQANKLRDAHHDAAAYKMLKQIVEHWPKSSAADQARKLISDYESDPNFVAAQDEANTDQKARSMLSLARSYATAGRDDLARDACNKLIAAYPKSDAADKARELLKTLH